MEERSPQSSRPISEAWVGGVCAGLANHLKWSVLALRLLFVLATSYRLIGVVIYLALWLVMPNRKLESTTWGLDAAERGGMRSEAAGRKRFFDFGIAAALLLLGSGLIWIVERSGAGLGTYFIPAALGALGLGAIWWETDRIQLVDRPRTGITAWLSILAHNWTKILIVSLGLCSLAAAGAWIVIDHPLDDAARTALIIGLLIVGLGLAVAPLLLQLRQELALARDGKLVADARADMAAHLHDSVLQTLALIQRQADDPQQVQALARKQERELRAYLYEEEAEEASFSQGLNQLIKSVEDAHDVSIELVAVGEVQSCPAEKQEALLGAIREAAVNAAKHSGQTHIDIFTEAEPDLISVFVRDRGSGFDISAIPADRLGVRGSIVERMERAGGRAIIRSSPGTGSEIRLEMPR